MNSASVPRLARKIFGRAPVAPASGRRRRATLRTARRGAAAAAARAAAGGRRRHRRGTSSTRRPGFVEIGEDADAGERVLAAARPPLRARRAPPATLLLDQAACRAPRRRRRLARSPGTEPRPRGRARRSNPRCRRSRRPDRRPWRGAIPPAGRSCVLRAMRRAKRSGSPSAAVNGSTVIASAPPKPGREHRDRGAQDVHVRVALRHHAPRGLGRDESRRRRKPARLSTRAHNFRRARNFAMVRN